MKYFIKPEHNRRVCNSPISSSTQRSNVPHGLALPAELVPIIQEHSYDYHNSNDSRFHKRTLMAVQLYIQGSKNILNSWFTFVHYTG